MMGKFLEIERIILALARTEGHTHTPDPDTVNIPSTLPNSGVLLDLTAVPVELNKPEDNRQLAEAICNEYA